MIIQSMLFLITSLTVFLILTEILTINISYGEVTVIDINLTIFAIRLTTKKNGNSSKRKKRRQRNSFKSILGLIFTASKKSDIVLQRLNISLPEGEPSGTAIKQGIYLSLISSVLAYAESKAKNLYIGNITFDNSANNNLKIAFDISFRISLMSFLASLCIYMKRQKKGYGLLWQKAK